MDIRYGTTTCSAMRNLNGGAKKTSTAFYFQWYWGGDFPTESCGNAQCYNSAEKLARKGNFDNFSMEICGCGYIHKYPDNMKQAMEKNL